MCFKAYKYIRHLCGQHGRHITLQGGSQIIWSTSNIFLRLDITPLTPFQLETHFGDELTWN